MRRWILFGVASLAAVAVWAGYEARQRRIWPFHEREEVIKGTLLPQRKIEPWKPASEDDKVIDRFVTLLPDKKADAHAMLTDPPPDFPRTTEDMARRKADLALRDKNLRILTVFRGEPGPDGNPKPAPRRYTLVTKGFVEYPRQEVKMKDAKVKVETGGVLDPDVVVEVQGISKPRIRPIRAEPAKQP
jgi:hypothetical protein